MDFNFATISKWTFVTPLCQCIEHIRNEYDYFSLIVLSFNSGQWVIVLLDTKLVVLKIRIGQKIFNRPIIYKAYQLVIEMKSIDENDSLVPYRWMLSAPTSKHVPPFLLKVHWSNKRYQSKLQKVIC